MSVTLEQVEQLRAHAAVSYEEARRALEACDGDLLDALILLEGRFFHHPARGRPGAAALRAHPGAGGVREGREAVLGAGRDRGRPPRPGGAGELARPPAGAAGGGGGSAAPLHGQPV